MRVDMKNDAKEMLEAAGVKNVQTMIVIYAPGMGIHEMGLPEWDVIRKHRY